MLEGGKRFREGLLVEEEEKGFDVGFGRIWLGYGKVSGREK